MPLMEVSEKCVWLFSTWCSPVSAEPGHRSALQQACCGKGKHSAAPAILARQPSPSKMLLLLMSKLHQLHGQRGCLTACWEQLDC